MGFSPVGLMNFVPMVLRNGQTSAETLPDADGVKSCDCKHDKQGRHGNNGRQDVKDSAADGAGHRKSRDVRQLAQQMGYLKTDQGNHYGQIMNGGMDQALFSPEGLLASAMQEMKQGESDLDFVGEEMLDTMQDLYRRAEAVESGRTSESMLDTALETARQDMTALFQEIGFSEEESTGYAGQVVDAIMQASEADTGKIELSFEKLLAEQQQVASAQSYSYQQVDTPEGSWVSESASQAEQFLTTMQMRNVDISIDLDSGTLDVDLSRTNAAESLVQMQSTSREQYQPALGAADAYQPAENESLPDPEAAVSQQVESSDENAVSRFQQKAFEMLSRLTSREGGGRPAGAGRPHGPPPPPKSESVDETDETDETEETTETTDETTTETEDAITTDVTTDDTTVATSADATQVDDETAISDETSEEPVEASEVEVPEEETAPEPQIGIGSEFMARLRKLSLQLQQDGTLGGSFNTWFEISDIQFEQSQTGNAMSFSLNATMAVGFMQFTPVSQSEPLIAQEDTTSVQAVQPGFDLEA